MNVSQIRSSELGTYGTLFLPFRPLEVTAWGGDGETGARGAITAPPVSPDSEASRL